MTPRWLPEPSEEELYGNEHPGHEVPGRFEPRDANRILARLEQAHILSRSTLQVRSARVQLTSGVALPVHLRSP